MLKRLLVSVGCIFFMMNVFAQPVVQGVDYTIVDSPSISKNSGKKINIKEFFSFTCIHCKDVEPLIEASVIKNKKVDLERIQVPWDAMTTSLAKLNATYQALHLDQLYKPTFDAVFANKNLNDPKVLGEFLKSNNVDQKRFMATYNSFTISTDIAKYKALMKTYNVDGTPTFVVANKYVLKPAQPARIVEVLNYLINKTAKKS
jgi:protein dithiol oxidoreductase (disulfide-forming)